MKGRVILIDEPKERASQAALLVDGRLEDLLLDPLKGDATPAPGAIYWAKVDRLVPRMHGAFVRLTPEHTGFLREAKGLKEGRGVLVQVASYPEPGKATPVTTRLLYKGRRVIHTPDAPGLNVSRRIRDESERERLRAVTAEIVEEGLRTAAEDDRYVWENLGLILRSAAEGAAASELKEEVREMLSARCRTDRLKVESPPLPRPARCAPEAAALAQREWDGHVERGSGAFARHGVWDEIERLKSPRVELPSGAWMAVEATRAMVTVDVNTAAEFSGGAALKANLEAARELPRQLRLRGLGGQVIVDFAPLKKPDRRRIEDAVKTSFRRDPVDTTLAGWTPLGHFELQRKRERRPLAELLD